MLRKLRKKGFGASSRSQTENFYSQEQLLLCSASSRCLVQRAPAEEDNDKTAKKATFAQTRAQVLCAFGDE